MNTPGNTNPAILLQMMDKLLDEDDDQPKDENPGAEENNGGIK
jgi:hypothetical protein